MTKDEALKMCLEYIETNAQGSKFAILIKEALAQPERLAELGWQEIDCPICGGGARVFPKPEQAQFKLLTDEEVIKMSRYDLEYAALIGEVQRRLKEKNT